MSEGSAEKAEPFHVRHKGLLILCTIAGVKIRAVDRIEMSHRTRKLLGYCRVFMSSILWSLFANSLFCLLFMKNDSVYNFIHSFMILGCSTHGSFRQFYMHQKIDKFDELYKAWDNLFGKDDDWKSRQKIVDTFYADARKSIGILGIWTTVMLTVYSTSSFFSEEKISQLPTILPYSHQSPDFEILVSYFAFGIFIFAIAVSSSQMLLITPVIWELGETYRLRERLAGIIRECEFVSEVFTTSGSETFLVKRFTSRGISDVDRKMKVWVEQHQKLVKFHKMSMDLNNFELGMEMVATLIEAVAMAILCTSDYYAPIDQFTTLCTFVGYFALFYYSCAKCTKLSDLSMAVADDAFAESWSSLPLKAKKNFLMIISMTMKPLNYYGAYVFRIDIITFSQIMRTAYSVFQVFYNIVGRD